MSLMRIDKFLAECGEGSRSAAKKLIKSGKVYSDNIKITNCEHKIDTEKNTVTVGGKVLSYDKYIYIMLNKPKGVVSAVKDEKYKTVTDILDEKDRRRGLFPVGRLDIDTEGLLIITNDGDFAHDTLSPKKHVVKRYYAEVSGKVTSEDVSSFNEGMMLYGHKLKPAKLEIIEADEISKVYVEISEGKYHQIKEMFRKVGKKVVYLKRTAFGALKLDENLSVGEYRLLTHDEMSLFSLCGDDRTQ